MIFLINFLYKLAYEQEGNIRIIAYAVYNR